jgi:hypothetical protein
MPNRSAFEYFLRTGRRIADPLETKFNPWHDPDDGRFTFANQGRYFGRGAPRSREAATARTGAPRAIGRTAPNPRQLQPASSGRKPGPSQNAATYISNPAQAIRRIGREMATSRRLTPVPEQLVQSFKRHMIPEEGNRNDVYPDKRKIPTVGIGHKVVPADKLKLGDVISDARKEALWRQDSEKALRATLQQMKDAGIRDPRFVNPLASVKLPTG